jgi:hypothetical protein
LQHAQALVHSWDSQGFIYAETLTTMAAVNEAIERIGALNQAEIDADEAVDA